MNAACMFWDNNGNKTLSYNPESRNWKAISTEEEFARARVFTSIYNDELARLKAVYGIDRFPPACMGIFHQPKRPIIQKKSER